MTHRRQILQVAAAGLAAGTWPRAFAEAAPPVIRIGIASGGVGSPVRHGGSTLALARSSGALDREFAADNIRVDWIFFKGAGPAVNEALVNRQLDLAWQGDLPSIVHRDVVLAAVVVVGIVGYAFDKGFAAIERRLLGWRREAF